jgi:hypothetical protein
MDAMTVLDPGSLLGGRENLFRAVDGKRLAAVPAWE